MDKEKLYEITDYLEWLLSVANDIKMHQIEQEDLENLIKWCKEQSGQDKIEKAIDKFFDDVI